MTVFCLHFKCLSKISRTISNIFSQILGILPLRYCPIVFGTICALWSFPPILNKILFEGKGRNGSTVAVSTDQQNICIKQHQRQTLYHQLTTKLCFSLIKNKLFFHQGTSVITPIIPLLFVLVPAGYLASNSPENILETNPLRFIMTFGLIGSKITNKLIVSSAGQITNIAILATDN